MKMTSSAVTKKMSMTLFGVWDAVYKKENLSSNPIAAGVQIEANKCRDKDWQINVDTCQPDSMQLSSSKLTTVLHIEVMKLSNVIKLQLE